MTPLTPPAHSAVCFRSVGLSVRTFRIRNGNCWKHPLPAVPQLPGLRCQATSAEAGSTCKQKLSRLGVKIPIIFITGHGDIPMSVQAMKGRRKSIS